MEDIFTEAQYFRFFRPLDVYFARMLATSIQPGLMLACACLSSDTGAGHVCLPLKLLTEEHLFENRMPSLARKAWIKAGAPIIEEWQRYLLAVNVVSDGSNPSPLVLDNQCLYLQRMWQDECTVAEFFNRPQLLKKTKENNIRTALERYFPGSSSNEIDWQKVAAAVASTHRVALISGGPGTGKTYTVAKLLAVLLLQSENSNHLRIILAAPTGKAALRLKESLDFASQQLDLNEIQKQQWPHDAVTLHRLLGAGPNSQRMRYHRGNLLHVDILIIDEASMIDLPMMANVISALPAHARVIFLGDRYQLSSVEAGAVLNDISRYSEVGYSPKRRAELARLTGFNLPISLESRHYGISDSFCLLRKSYRFKKRSGIDRLASAINKGDANGVLLQLNAVKISSDILYAPLRNIAEYHRMLNDCVNGYRDYLQRVHNYDTPCTILNAFNRFQLLCALREGPFGVSGLNYHIERALNQAGLITVSSTSQDYAGRPIMILRNASEIGLYNGDIGIFLSNKAHVLRAYFLLPNGEVREVSLIRLPEHETAFAMTVHKSQGSEFYHTALALPSQFLPGLTRELLYTAVTRACARLSLYAKEEILRWTISNKIQRRSCLTKRLAVPIRHGFG